MLILQALCKQGTPATSFGPKESDTVFSVPLLQNDTAPLQDLPNYKPYLNKSQSLFPKDEAHDPCPRAVYWFKENLAQFCPISIYLGITSTSAICR